MGVPILVRRHLYIESGPRSLHWQCYGCMPVEQTRRIWVNMNTRWIIMQPKQTKHSKDYTKTPHCLPMAGAFPHIWPVILTAFPWYQVIIAWCVTQVIYRSRMWWLGLGHSFYLCFRNDLGAENHLLLLLSPSQSFQSSDWFLDSCSENECSRNVVKDSGGRLNKKDGLIWYGDSHVKDKTSWRPSYL